MAQTREQAKKRIHHLLSIAPVLVYCFQSSQITLLVKCNMSFFMNITIILNINIDLADQLFASAFGFGK